MKQTHADSSHATVTPVAADVEMLPDAAGDGRQVMGNWQVVCMWLLCGLGWAFKLSLWAFTLKECDILEMGP
uniref:Uncharacterized protein n=1 Tax=Arundo donax TaxID=35708 RepID=A0A0A8Z5J2_ARUDO